MKMKKLEPVARDVLETKRKQEAIFILEERLREIDQAQAALDRLKKDLKIMLEEDVADVVERANRLR